MGRNKALRVTLDAILKQCGDEPAGDVEVCGGAASALYFFSTPNDDTVIQTFLREAPPLVFERVLEEDITWLFNRADKQMWRDWVSTLEMNADYRRIVLPVLDENSLDAKSVGTLSIDIL